jgi:dTDP-4-amino-4,6-dideoxygalactose transaminase
MLDALCSRSHGGNGLYGEKCISLLKDKYGFLSVFLTPSCTAAMEMGALLANLSAGDEVILPSYTFSSTANAIVLRGARPVFCDIDPNTMNINVELIEPLITERTRMIAPIDYAGIPCEMDAILEIARKRELMVMQDAAQSLHAYYKNRPSGALSPLAAFSFHESKNVSCGEGGALIVNQPDLVERAGFLQEKGTDRSLVLRGQKHKYSWVDIGSSFLLSDVLAAMLLAQLEAVELIMSKRSRITRAYQALFSPYEKRGCVRLPKPPAHTQINHHAFFVIFDSADNRQRFLSLTNVKDIHPYIGYVPLHSSPMGRKWGYRPEDVPVTEDIGQRIVRLPFYTDLADQGLDYCLIEMSAVIRQMYGF